MVRRSVVGCLALVFALNAAAFAQNDKEAIKKKILEKIEAKLKAEEEKILKELEKIIDEELAKLDGGAPKDPEPKKPDPKDPDPKKPDPETPDRTDLMYKGAGACKMCHNKKDKGEAHAKWSASSHAKAFTDLAGDKAKKVCEERKLGDAQKEKSCLECHVTAYGVEAKMLDAKFKPEDGVQCESCHGPGELHIKNRVKEAALKKTIERGALKDEIRLGTEATCKRCHNEKSPFYKEFKFDEFKKVIDHTDPTRGK